ncbi:MAG: STAS domain-containing protein [Polyangiaceae bacterium]
MAGEIQAREATSMAHQRTDNGEETTLTIDGTLDALTAPELRPSLDALVTEGRKSITIDLSNLRLIDSSGVGALVSLLKRVRAYGGEVRIAGLKDQPRAIFRLLQLDRVFPGQPGS